MGKVAYKIVWTEVSYYSACYDSWDDHYEYTERSDDEIFLSRENAEKALINQGFSLQDKDDPNVWYYDGFNYHDPSLENQPCGGCKRIEELKIADA